VLPRVVTRLVTQVLTSCHVGLARRCRSRPRQPAREHHNDGRDDQESPPALLRRAPDKMIMHNSAGIMPGGDVGLRFGWDLPG
jgi:hypothetical protein